MKVETKQRESREQLTRDAVAHDDLDDTDRLAVPVEDGFVFRWIRYAIRGEADVGNVNKRFDRQGWIPVQAADVPPRYRVQICGNGRFEGCVQNGDLLLAKMPLERALAYRAKNRKAVADQEAGIRNQLARANDDPRMPIFNTSRSTVSHGTRRPSFDD